MAKQRYDLDALADTAIEFTLFDKVYEMREPTLQMLPELRRLTEEYKLDEVRRGEMMTDEQLIGLRKSVMILCPDLTEEVMGKLTLTQWLVMQRLSAEVNAPAQERIAALFGSTAPAEEDLSDDQGEAVEESPAQ